MSSGATFFRLGGDAWANAGADAGITDNMSPNADCHTRTKSDILRHRSADSIFQIFQPTNLLSNRSELKSTKDRGGEVAYLACERDALRRSSVKGAISLAVEVGGEGQRRRRRES